METQAVLFDRAAVLTVKVEGPEDKTCEVRFPTDEEWRELYRRVQSVSKFLGNGEMERQNNTSDVAPSATLFAAIRVSPNGHGPGPEIDDYEALAVVNQLALATVRSCERDGGTFTVELSVPRPGDGELRMRRVRHVVKVPTQRQRVEYERAQPPARVGAGYVKNRLTLDPGADLYDAIHVSHEGYAGDGSPKDVPILHKSEVAEAVIGALVQSMRLIESDPE